MSAWYVFAAMGFYPVDPVSGDYLLCSPLFDKIEIDVTNQKQFEIIVHRTSTNAIFIQKIKWNHQDFNKYAIRHSMITGGGVLEIWLGEKAPTN